MQYEYLKALHIIFVVTWFAGMFYMPRLFIYNTEANEKEEPSKTILHEQFSVMMKRLWFGITFPSAILTLIFGTVVMFKGGWDQVLLNEQGRWLLVKLCLVLLLYIYFFSLHKIFKQQLKGVFKYSSQQLRIWNEVATIFFGSDCYACHRKTKHKFCLGISWINLLCCFINECNKNL